MYMKTALQRPSAATQKHWPVSKLHAFSLPGESYGWGKLADTLLKARGWKILRPCTVVHEGNPEDILLFLDEFEGLLRGHSIQGKPEANQTLVCRGPAKLPSHALMLMNSALSRDDVARMFLANKPHFCHPGTAYAHCVIAGSEASLYKCNISKAFRNDDWYPKAYVLPQETHLLHRDIKSSSKSYWIAKPNDDFGGTGITVWSHDDPGFLKLVRDTKNQKRSIVQRYLHDPMLLGPFKFHMRIHMVITSLNPLKAYVHEGGQVLCGTRPYSLSKKLLNKNFDRAVHLTNQCFNANPSNKDNYLRKKPVIGKGQQITIPELEQYLKKNHKGFDKQDLWRQIVHIGKRMAEHIVGWRTVRQHIGKSKSGQVFEIYGMDLMLDRSMKVWMCETNNSPGLGFPDRKLLGAPNPDYPKEVKMCRSVFHDTMTLLGFDAGKRQTKGSLAHWYEIDFSEQK